MDLYPHEIMLELILYPTPNQRSENPIPPSYLYNLRMAVVERIYIPAP